MLSSRLKTRILTTNRMIKKKVKLQSQIAKHNVSKLD